MDKKLVVVTGASSGIGMAATRAFSQAGHPLLLVARRRDRMEALALPKAICRQVDVTEPNALADALAEAEDTHGPVDCLVNNAGITVNGPIEAQTPDQWQRAFDVNVMGVLHGIHVVLKGMLNRGTGAIINVGSVAGFKTFPGAAVYCGTKFAVHGISEAVREEVAGRNVRVMTIAPGVVETEIFEHVPDAEVRKSLAEWKQSIGGGIAADDVARAILFAYQQPQSVCIREIVIAPTAQGQ